MKLKELSIEGTGGYRHLQLGRFADGLSIVYGENGAGKSTLRQFVRGTLTGFSAIDQIPDLRQYSAGRLTVTHEAGEFQLSRDVLPNTQLDVRPLSAGYGVDQVPTLRKCTGHLNQELYDTVFNFSCCDTESNARSLAHVLQSQLGVPSGPAAAGDNSDYVNWQHESNVRRERLLALQGKIEALQNEKSAGLRQMESDRLDRQSRLNEIEHQISHVIARINEAQTINETNELAHVEREIERIRLAIDNAPRQMPNTQEIPRVNEFSSLYLRLDEFDNQIRRWRHVQSDIQNQRVRLRDEMLVWNELTLDSDEHPYHTSRAILVALESKVDEAERNANHWSDAGGSRIDTSQMVRTLSQLCQSMREDLYGLCNELSQQYKFIRHKAAAAELKQLRRCYKEMAENIERLIKRRESVIRDIREVDPAGADAIVRADSSFCQCARHEGYLEARRRHVGQVPIVTSPPVTPVKSPSLHIERGQLVALEQKRSDLIALIARYQSENQTLENQHADLIRQRDVLLTEINSSQLSQRIREIDSELANLNNEFTALRKIVEQDRDFVPVPPSPLLQLACDLLSRISSGDLVQVFLGEPYLTSSRNAQHEIQVRDRLGKVLNLSALEPWRQDQVYLCLVFAAKEQLQQINIEAPTIIDDAFRRIPSDQATAMLTVMNDFAGSRHQVLAFTQHRYLADRVPELPVFELPPPLPSSNPVVDPQRRSGVAPAPHSLPDSDWETAGREFVNLQNASPQPRPYPLSKYPRTGFDYSNNDHSYSETYPFPVQGNVDAATECSPGFNREPVDLRINSPAGSVSPIAVNTIGDRLGYVSAVDEAMRLGKVGFFDAQQLRNFEANGILNVGDLLAIELSDSNRLGINADQLDRWQSQLWLLINVPGMRISDARVLVACGITEPEQLETSHPQQLAERISRFLATSEGRRFARDRDVISQERINGWYRSIDATRSNWQNRNRSRRRNRAVQADRQFSYRGNPAVSHSFENNRNRRSRSYPSVVRPESSRQVATSEAGNQQREVPQGRDHGSTREPIQARSPRMQTPPPERKIVPRMAPAASLANAKKNTTTKQTTSKKSADPGKTKLKFYLDLNDHIEAAPAIGPKTAERFEKIGVFTVADFLKQTAESMAIKIKYKRISADVIRQWQQQARFVCRVPNMRGHDAQLLVACGITEPEELSTMQPQSLLDIIGPFSETKDGLKIIRNGKKPDLAEITDWISWAQHTRSLQAA